jgi:hypothetical protein
MDSIEKDWGVFLKRFGLLVTQTFCGPSRRNEHLSTLFIFASLKQNPHTSTTMINNA